MRKRLSMKAAAALLSRPAAWRAAVDAGNAVLPHTPHFVVHHPGNALGARA